jgi:hypothetical protein
MNTSALTATMFKDAQIAGQRRHDKVGLIAYLENLPVRTVSFASNPAGMRIAMSAKRQFKIVDVQRLDEDTIGVSYSDLTTALYTADQITELVPLVVFEKNKSERDFTIN